jgi:hypothetical protein
MRVLISGTEGDLVCRCIPKLFEDGIFHEGGFE